MGKQYKKVRKRIRLKNYRERLKARQKANKASSAS